MWAGCWRGRRERDEFGTAMQSVIARPLKLDGGARSNAVVWFR